MVQLTFDYGSDGLLSAAGKYDMINFRFGGVMIRKALLLVFLFSGVEAANAAGPWCKSNCTELCQMSAADTGMTVEFCINKYKCSRFPASPCASAEYMQTRLGQIRSYRGGGSGR
jgi:hypothetical protein